MKVKYNSEYHDVYSCQCGAQKSYKTIFSQAESPVGYAFFGFSLFNVGNKIKFCEKCQFYWRDGNVKYFHELSFIKKVLYCMGWVVLPAYLPFWLIFDFDYDTSIWIKIFSPLLFLLGFFLQCWLIFLALLINAFCCLFAFIPHIVIASKSKKVEKEDFLREQKMKMHREMLYEYILKNTVFFNLND